MTAPTIADEVLALLPQWCPDDSEEAPTVPGSVTAGIAQITVMAKAYTRGNGFTGAVPNDEIRAVVVTASVRFLANPYQFAVDFNDKTRLSALRGGFTGWTPAELAVLNRYRVRAQ